MKIFTYEEYLAYLKQVKQFAMLNFELALERKLFLDAYGVKEEKEYSLSDIEEIYQYGSQTKSKVSHLQDKRFREILEDKREVIYVIEKTLGEDFHLTPEMLQMELLQSEESAIVYRLIETNTFFFIEHLRKVEENMPAKWLGNMVEIMRTALTYVDMRTYMRMPTVIPIIVYTGNEEWNVSQWLKDSQKNLFPFQKIGLGEYNILKSSELKEAELLQEDCLISKMFLIDRAKHV